MAKGEGQGEGRGGDDTRMIVGGGVAICIAVCFFLFGLPMLIGGSVLIVLFKDLQVEAFDDNLMLIIGISLVAVSALFVIIGTAVAICICCCGGKDSNQPPGVGMVHTGQAYPPQAYPGSQPQYAIAEPQYPGAQPQYPVGQQQYLGAQYPACQPYPEKYAGQQYTAQSYDMPRY